MVGSCNYMSYFQLFYFKVPLWKYQIVHEEDILHDPHEFIGSSVSDTAWKFIPQNSVRFIDCLQLRLLSINNSTLLNLLHILAD